MHAQGVSHRDIKLENIFIGDDFALRLGDFSYAAKTRCPQSGQEVVHTDQPGTKFYVAPEIMRGKPYLGRPADVFSLGVTLFMMVMGQNPFKSYQFYKALWKRENTDLFWSQFTKSKRGEWARSSRLSSRGCSTTTLRPGSRLRRSASTPGVRCTSWTKSSLSLASTSVSPTEDAEARAKS